MLSSYVSCEGIRKLWVYHTSNQSEHNARKGKKKFSSPVVEDQQNVSFTSSSTTTAIATAVNGLV